MALCTNEMPEMKFELNSWVTGVTGRAYGGNVSGVSCSRCAVKELEEKKKKEKMEKRKRRDGKKTLRETFRC